MTLKLKQGLWLWAGALALMLLAIIPLGGWGRAAVALIVVGCVALACVRAARQRQLPGPLDNLALPPAAYRHPVVLVCGDGLAGLFGETCNDQPALRMTERGCYLRVSRAEQLPRVTDSVLALRPEWAGQLCVMFIVNPGEHTDAAVLAGHVRTFNYQAGLIRQRGIALPLMLISYLQSSASKGAWFSWEAGQDSCNIREGGSCLGPNDWHRLPAEHATHTRRLQANLLESACDGTRTTVSVFPAESLRIARGAGGAGGRGQSVSVLPAAGASPARPSAAGQHQPSGRRPGTVSPGPRHGLSRR